MKRLVALALVVSVVWGAQSPTKEPQGRIAGTVRSATTSEPLKSVVVSLRLQAQGQGFSKTAASGLEGDFAFDQLPAGRYELVFRKTGYRTMPGPGAAVALRKNQKTDDLVFGLWPLGAIEGRVLDSDGEPVPEARVRAYHVRHRHTGVFLSPHGRAESDDLGEYRIYDLAAGHYLIGVAPPRAGTPAAEYYANTAGSFYPGVPGPSQALPLKLAWGQDLSGVDPRLAEGATYGVMGTVWDVSMDGPCPGCVVRAVLIDGSLRVGLSNTARASREGLFVLRGLGPGDYRIIARRGGREGAVSQTQVAVRDRNLEDVALLVGQVQPISGEIVLEDAPDGADAARWVPYVSSMPPSTSWPDGEGEVSEKLRFEIGGLPAATYLFQVLDLPNGAYLKALRLGGQPLAGPEVTVTAYAPLTGLEAVIAFDAAGVSGQVRARRATGDDVEGPIEAKVTLIPRSNQSGYLAAQSVATGPDGRFRFATVVPGAYRLYALPAMSSAQIFDPAVQLSLRSSSEPVNLEPEESATVELWVAPHSQVTY